MSPAKYQRLSRKVAGYFHARYETREPNMSHQPEEAVREGRRRSSFLWEGGRKVKTAPAEGAETHSSLLQNITSTFHSVFTICGRHDLSRAQAKKNTLGVSKGRRASSCKSALLMKKWNADRARTPRPKAPCQDTVEPLLEVDVPSEKCLGGESKRCS